MLLVALAVREVVTGLQARDERPLAGRSPEKRDAVWI
jgi:hypothetical protein